MDKMMNKAVFAILLNVLNLNRMCYLYLYTIYTLEEMLGDGVKLVTVFATWPQS